jgi:hypothetical protein
MLLTGCGNSSEQETTSTVESAVPKAPKTVPDTAGKTFGEAHDLLVASGIVYVAVGSDGAKFTDTPPRTAVVAGTDPGAGLEVSGGTVTLTIKGSEKDLAAKLAAAKAKSAAEAQAAIRATRYEFRCSPSEDAITADDNQVFHSHKEIWASPAFKTFRSCDLDIAGTWYRDSYILEDYETAVVDQVRAGGGDVSLPSSTLGQVLLLCTIPPGEGWDLKYGENPAGPKVRSEAKAAVKMCPSAPFIAELKRVANGVPPAPKTAMDDGTFTVGKDIAAGTYQVKVPAGANGIHDCYWERTEPQGGTIANDFLTFAPQGPVVTLYAGEGFVSKSCGTWTKIG